MSDVNIIRDEEVGDDCREQFSRDWGIAFNYLRGWNEAMMGWLGNISLDRPEEPMCVPVKYQTPERAFANYVQPRVNGQVDLPIISFIMTASAFDRERFYSPPSIPMPWRKTRVGDRWIMENRPMPWELTYNVTVWTKFQDDLDLIAYNLLSRFTPDSYLYNSGMPAKVDFISHTDTSDLEGGETRDRVLRNDYTFKVDAYMALPYREVGSINKAFLVLTDKASNDLIDSDTLDVDLSEDVQIVEDFEENNNDSTLNPGVYTKSQ